jgi:protocadherin alpha
MVHVFNFSLFLQTCPGKCKENKACVQCAAFSSGPLTEEECIRDCRKDLIHIKDNLPGKIVVKGREEKI